MRIGNLVQENLHVSLLPSPPVVGTIDVDITVGVHKFHGAYASLAATPPDVTEVVSATLVTISGLLEVDSETGWLAVVGEWGEGAGDVCACTLSSPVEEVRTVHWLIPTEFPASLPTTRMTCTLLRASTNLVVNNYTTSFACIQHCTYSWVLSAPEPQACTANAIK